MRRGQLMVWFAVSIVAMGLVFGGLLFGIAGTWDYWQAWVFLGVFFTLTILISGYFIIVDPALLSRRMSGLEPRRAQRLIVFGAWLAYFGTFVIAGLDRRYGWSHVPLALVIAGEVATVASFLFTAYVFAVNRFAASTIRVETGQQVIDTGPYAVVRHPMYSGALVMLAGMSPALGTWWGLWLLPLWVVALGLRAVNEEALLRAELPGYADYMRRVRWRMIPGVW